MKTAEYVFFTLLTFLNAASCFAQNDAAQTSTKRGWEDLVQGATQVVADRTKAELIQWFIDDTTRSLCTNLPMLFENTCDLIGATDSLSYLPYDSLAANMQKDLEKLPLKLAVAKQLSVRLYSIRNKVKEVTSKYFFEFGSQIPMLRLGDEQVSERLDKVFEELEKEGVVLDKKEVKRETFSRLYDEYKSVKNPTSYLLAMINLANNYLKYFFPSVKIEYKDGVVDAILPAITSVITKDCLESSDCKYYMQEVLGAREEAVEAKLKKFVSLSFHLITDDNFDEIGIEKLQDAKSAAHELRNSKKIFGVRYVWVVKLYNALVKIRKGVSVRDALIDFGDDLYNGGTLKCNGNGKEDTLQRNICPVIAFSIIAKNTIANQEKPDAVVENIKNELENATINLPNLIDDDAKMFFLRSVVKKTRVLYRLESEMSDAKPSERLNMALKLTAATADLALTVAQKVKWDGGTQTLESEYAANAIFIAGKMVAGDYKETLMDLVEISAKSNVIRQNQFSDIQVALDVANAANRENIATLLEQISSPVGGWRIKKKHSFVSLDVIAGMDGGIEWEVAGGAHINKDYGYVTQVMARVGVSMSSPTATSAGPIKFNYASGYYLSIIDLGKPLSAKFSSTTNYQTNVGLKQLISPGLYTYILPINSPLVIGGGVSFSPDIRKTPEDSKSSALQLTIFLGVNSVMIPFAKYR